MLAFGAEMGATASQQGAADGGGAFAAGLAGSEVDAVLKLEKAFNSVGVDVIGDRGAAELDGMEEDLFEGDAEGLEARGSDAPGAEGGADAGGEERLIGVDVADAGEKRLVEQCGLDGELAAFEESTELFAANGKRVESCRGKFLSAGFARVGCELAKFEAAEAAWVHEAQLATRCELQAGVGVRRHFAVRGGDEQAASHAEVDNPLCCVRRTCRGAELADDMLAGAMDRSNSPSDESARLMQARGLEGLRNSAEPGFGDAVASDAFVDAAGDGFNFRKFRHECWA